MLNCCELFKIYHSSDLTSSPFLEDFFFKIEASGTQDCVFSHSIWLLNLLVNQLITYSM